MTWFGATSEDRRRTFGLLVTLVLVSPFILGVYILSALKVPCVMPSPDPRAAP